MPLMMGDWLRGTRGMKAEVRGVYINLLIHQYDHGYLPSDMETLALIEPEIHKVWVFLKEKFLEVAPGKLQNKKLEEVRSFWEKQGSNGKKGGRPKKENPKPNPDNNPNGNPNHNHHNDLDHDNDLYLKNKKESVKIDFKKPDIVGDELVFPLDTQTVRDLWAAWKEARWHNYELRYGLHGEQADLKRMQGMTFHQIQETIQQAIAGKWKNLYPSHGKNGIIRATTKQQQTTDTAEYLKQHYSERAAGKQV